jgi:hypothetical protein
MEVGEDGDGAGVRLSRCFFRVGWAALTMDGVDSALVEPVGVKWTKCRVRARDPGRAKVFSLSALRELTANNAPRNNRVMVGSF